jgi:spermidine synthase
VNDEYRVQHHLMTDRGEIALLRRGEGHLELRVNGVFVMDTVETTSERVLAEATLQRLDDPGVILLGGLGLGFTVRALLEDDRVKRVFVVEIEPDVVGWMRDGDIPGGAQLLADPRVEVVVGDVRDVLPAMPAGSLDGIILDVDNGPEHLVYESNAGVYEVGFLGICLSRLRPSGAFTVWSSTRSAALVDGLRAVAGAYEEQVVRVLRGMRSEEYVVYLATPRRTSSG